MHISRIPLRKINNIKMLINPLPGSEIGIPLFFLEKHFLEKESKVIKKEHLLEDRGQGLLTNYKK